MTEPNLTRDARNASRRLGWIGKTLASAAAVPSLVGCVQVTAPERPIEINLNINIRQEVVVRLQEDVRELIQQNPGVF
ncbi:YnbE family lipoprotein [Sphingomonadaceae bacterium KCTC 52780]|uniref:YnbE family lipoprotein n=1 Tax=Sphingosinicella terrae TaxID=2172047 RepID=UPI000E0CD748